MIILITTKLKVNMKNLYEKSYDEILKQTKRICSSNYESM